MPASPAVFHALLRPAIIQILRATGFHSAKPAVIDSLTDLAARYLEILCNQTSHNAAERALNEAYVGEAEPAIVDVRVALQEIGAFMPECDWEEQDFAEVEDTRGVEDFLAWAKGPKTEQMKRVALDGSEEGVADYLSGTLLLKMHFTPCTLADIVATIALKKRHSRTADDSKFAGTFLGKPPDHGPVVIEGGGEVDSIQSWNEKRRGSPRKSPDTDADSRPPSSGLSSVGTLGEDMDMS